MVEATKASSSENCSLPEDGIYKGTLSDNEERTQTCISPQDVANDEATIYHTKEDESKSSLNIPLDVSSITFEPELRNNVTCSGKFGNDENRIMKTRLGNEGEKIGDEINTFDDSHTNEKDLTIATAEKVQTKNSIYSYKIDIHLNTRDDKKTYPRDIEYEDVMHSDAENREQNQTIDVLKGCITKPIEDDKEDNADINEGHARLKSKGNTKAIKDNLKWGVVSSTRTNGFE